MLWTDINLVRNPFQYTNPTNSSNLVWAGLKTVKEAVERVYIGAYQRTARQIVLNWGPYGGGKTHAAYYFTPSKIESIREENFIHIYCRLPKDSSQATKQLVDNIIDSLRVSKIKEMLEKVYNEVGKEYLHEYITNQIQSEEFADAIIKFAEPAHATHALLSKYLFDGLSGAKLDKLNIARSLKNDNDRVKFLAGILIAISASPTENKRIFLWVDEMEDLVSYNSKHYKIFSQMLRDLIDTVNEKMVFFMNFTLAENEENTIKMVLGESLWVRINQKIRFQNLTVEESIEYCQELINFQIVSKEAPSPLNDECIRFLVQSLPENMLNPREINKICSPFLEYILENHITQISSEIVKVWLNSFVLTKS